MTDQLPSADASGSPPAPRRRRSSFAELFSPRTSSTVPASSSSVPPGASTTAGNPPQHRRALSQALGISGGSPTQSSPFNAFTKQRRASVSTSSGSGSPEFRNSFGDEPVVIEEDDDAARVPVRPPASPTFARRLSFGAQALRDVRNGGNSGGVAGGRRPSSSTLYTLRESQENKAPKTAATGGEGFNWAEAIRERNKRSPSFSASSNSFAPRPRATSTAAVEPPKEISKPAATPPARMKKPDHLGERMLRGEFMMD